MVVRQKAIQIYKKFMDLPYPTGSERAKQCALICVNEIIVTLEDWAGQDAINYWNKVKKEIKKL